MEKRLHKEEIHDLYYLPNIIRLMTSRIMRWTRHVACMENKRVAYRIFVGRLEGKRQLGRHRPR